jgi:hypothetical protein
MDERPRARHFADAHFDERWTLGRGRRGKGGGKTLGGIRAAEGETERRRQQLEVRIGDFGGKLLPELPSLDSLHVAVAAILNRYDGKLTDVEIDGLGRLSNRIRMLKA